MSFGISIITFKVTNFLPKSFGTYMEYWISIFENPYVVQLPSRNSNLQHCTCAYAFIRGTILLKTVAGSLRFVVPVSTIVLSKLYCNSINEDDDANNTQAGRSAFSRAAEIFSRFFFSFYSQGKEEQERWQHETHVLPCCVTLCYNWEGGDSGGWRNGARATLSDGGKKQTPSWIANPKPVRSTPTTRARVSVEAALHHEVTSGVMHNVWQVGGTFGTG